MKSTTLFGITGLLLFCTAAAAVGTDELWEMSIKMEMAGMPSMPAHTSQVCKPRGDRDPARMGDKDDKSDCRTTDVKTAGAKTSWKVVCTKPDAATGSGEMTYTGDKMDGVIRMSGKMDGESYNMTQVISGKKIGSCTYEDPDKKAREMLARGQAETDKLCNREIDDLKPLMIFGNGQMSQEAMPCGGRKADFCARAAKVAKQMREPVGFADANSKYPEWREAMKACGTDPATVSGPVCKAGVDKKDWKFVADNCPVEGRALAEKHCVGLQYTAVTDSEYRDICQRHGADLAKQDVDAPAGAAEQKQNKTMDAVKEGANKLKKLLKF